MFSGTAQVSNRVCQFFVSSVCLLVRVTMVDKNVNWGHCGIPIETRSFVCERRL